MRSVYLTPDEDDGVVNMAEELTSNKAKYCREAILWRLQRDRAERGIPPLEIPDLPKVAEPGAEYGAVWTKRQQVRRLAMDLVTAIEEALTPTGEKKEQP